MQTKACPHIKIVKPRVSIGMQGKKKVWITLTQKFKVCYQSWGDTDVGILQGCETIYNATCQSELGMGHYLAGGTFPLLDYYWLCGNMAYPNLPRSWYGRCALVKLRAPIRIGYVGEPLPQLKPKIKPKQKLISKRDLKKHGHSNWWKHDTSDIPMEHRVIGQTAQFWKAFLIHNAVTDSMNWINRIHYELYRFANDTNIALALLTTEMGNIRQMTLENRMALDSMLAAEGGVCVRIGKECCTFIPAYDTNGGNISRVLSDMKMVRDTLWNDEQEKYKSLNGNLDWISNFFHDNFGNFLGPIIKFFMPILLIFIGFMILCTTRCIRALIKKLIQEVTGQHEGQYVQLNKLENVFDTWRAERAEVDVGGF